jgi:phosphoserine phosphatase
VAHRYDLVFLDCDSTLSAIEGIDALAARRGVDVAELTARAMAGELALEDVYRQRLDLIRPSVEDLEWVAMRYREEVVPKVRETVAALQADGVEVHVISGGLLLPVRDFSMWLGIPAIQVHAVPLTPPTAEVLAGDPVAVDAAWDESIAIACAHPLARNGGKPEIIEALAAEAGVPRARVLLAGDGASDLEAQSQVGLFVGFGGVANRELVRKGSGAWIAGPDLQPLQTLVLAN